MTEHDPTGASAPSALPALRDRLEHGDHDAVDELIELATELGDMNELRRLADAGNAEAPDELIQLAAEQGDLEELHRLSDGGNATATDQLIELATEQDNLDELRRLTPGQHHRDGTAHGTHHWMISTPNSAVPLRGDRKPARASTA
jgi:hypothetical protein